MTTMPEAPRRRFGIRGALTVAAPVALIASAALVWQASNAAFTATTDNTGNNFSSGSVALGDDDSATALLTPSNLKPGSTNAECIKVSYTGTLASSGVKLFVKPG